MAKKVIRRIRIEGNVAFIPLTRGHEAIIDAADVHLADCGPWQAFVELRRDGSVRTVYARRSIKMADGSRRPFLLHRFLLGDRDGLEVDHIDGNGLNNVRSNLRYVSKSQNQQNRRLQITSTSGHAGVTWHPHTKKWTAILISNGRRHYLGVHKDKSDAILAYMGARERLGLLPLPRPSWAGEKG